METKLFEVRDRGTFIPVICIKLVPTNEADRYLLGAAGFSTDLELQSSYILYGGLEGLNFEYQSGSHPNRTRNISHEYIEEHWADLQSGEVIDVEWIKGETNHKKVSQAVK